MIVTAAQDLVFNYITYIALSPDAIDDAKTVFTAMQEKGVIKENCSFDDDVWYTTDQYQNCGLHFTFNPFSYNSNYREVLSMSFSNFMNCVKAFIITVFGKNALLTIQSVLRDLRHIIDTPPSMISANSKQKTCIVNPHTCEDFFSQLPKYTENENLQRLVDSLDAIADTAIFSKTNQRTLADFESYFVFDEYMRRFWNTNEVTLEMKLFYAPLYLWWILTAVLPLRPKEFLVIPRDCLSKREGDYYLRLRRTRLKGGKQNVAYNLNDDFISDTYKVPDYIGRAFEEYLNLTATFPSTDIDTLFRTVPHYRKWNHAVPCDSRFLTYSNLRTILRYFYDEVLHSMYGLRPVCLDEGYHLERGQISRIHLGDARHIALINLMHSGGTPMLAMYLAGHQNQQMAAHYYSNVQKFIECQTYLYSRKMLSDGRGMQITPYRPLPPASAGIQLSDRGKCFSEKYRSGKFDDCQNVIGPGGEIGYCPTCTFYRAPGISRYEADDLYKRKIKDDCDGLKEAVEIVRKGKGNSDIEEIGEALLKIQASTYSYEQYLIQKHTNEEESNGTT